MKKRNYDDAKAWLDKAKAVNETAEVQNNYGVLAIWNGDLVEAKAHYEASQSNGGNVSKNLGILHVRTGDYEKALEYFGSDCSYNSALANLLNGDTEKAKAQSECAVGSAATSYLKAIIAARMDEATEMGKNLKSAVGENASYRKDAITDLEFSNFWDSIDFKGAIQ